MNAPQSRGQPIPEPSLTPENGWHCSHFFYRFRRELLESVDMKSRESGVGHWQHLLESHGEHRPARLGIYLTAGHKADFAVVMMDPDPIRIQSIHHRLLGAPLGHCIECTWSFVSVSEVSEYVPTVEQYAAKLQRDGEVAESPGLKAKVDAYGRRLPIMNEQRLRPEFPDWPAACFYPMNKVRSVGANWFTEPASLRTELMAEHGQSGMAFAGRVSQLITVGVGLDDWEWMVTLWARNPQYLKDIVYRMRFDEASAKYAEFGPFYTGYQMPITTIAQHCHVIRSANELA
jgi:hydrogen peroxide-dependent heme synthase